jgi:transposase
MLQRLRSYRQDVRTAVVPHVHSIRSQLKRRYVLAFFQKLPPILIGIEACASSHHWSRELKALGIRCD